MSQQAKKGKVIFAAAGPGDPELISVKAARSLKQADVILVDRLVSNKIVKEYVSPGAAIIYVGKQCRRGISTSQEDINNLMVQNALMGKLVVRLKGGDVSIYSNILDELESLVAHNIPYEIVPGVTAALGAAAYAGIPLTARGYATSVRFLTCYKSDVISDEYWKELAHTNDTLVFYMSSERLTTVVENLIAKNINEDKLLAVIEQATTPLQNVHITSLYHFKNNLAGRSFISPSIVIIGRVVSLHEKFKWLKNNLHNETYFQPVSGPVISLNHPDKLHKNVS